MTGGIVSSDVMNKLRENGWLSVGYNVCFNCLEGRSSLVSNPPVREFLSDISEFYGGDVAEHTFGSRSAQLAVFRTIADFVDGDGAAEYSKTVIVDSLCHYTTAIAAEAAGFRIVEVAHSGYPEYRIGGPAFADRIEEVKKETGKLPGLVVVTHVDPYYGNLSPAKEIGKIAREYGVPYMVNAAYTGGVMPVNMRELQADFLTVSAHKSMSSLAPLGFLVTSYDWGKKAFRTSSQALGWSGRAFGKKIPNLAGCSIGGAPLISSMLGFPEVVDRTRIWEEEVNKTRWLIDQLEDIQSIMLIGERPHRHHLVHIETPVFWEISRHHRRKGFFLAEELGNRGIIGLHKGLTRHVKLSVYGLPWEKVRQVAEAFHEVAKTCSVELSLPEQRTQSS